MKNITLSEINGVRVLGYEMDTAQMNALMGEIMGSLAGTQVIPGASAEMAADISFREIRGSYILTDDDYYSYANMYMVYDMKLMDQDLTAMVTQIAAFGYAATRLIPSVNRLNGHMTNIAFFQPSLDYVYENVDFSDYTKYGEYQNKDDANAAPIPVKDEIRLDHITYAYPNSTKNVLEDASMRIPIGKSVGVMGPSGAGKTTAIDILMGLLKVQQGTISCGGKNIFDNYPSWLSHIGYIPQSIFLTDDSLRENIAFGVEPDQIDDDRVWEVLAEAQMKEFVEQMPEQLNTSVGDRGVRLSGGQRQRIGIARALYHNPEILVFDEATSALDNDTESAIMEAIDSFHGRKTLIIIAHRLRTIENCDIIYNVDQGKITMTKGKL